ncbi:MAG: peptide deformylase [Chloroflexi bacterium]|nr:peptide deformylase [Chloroflexota bacterium]MDE2701940.1 peptide deformylase [Chloroflexota bacterium]MDE2862844.1 peptide deformylase [Chloroflexota bacterium]MXW29000.1 peptide deformylase [Chloroflexota bacterium]MXX67143.1 peptide deformylase [Chloroflexota bacterium]
MAVLPILPAQHPMLGRVAARVPKVDDSVRRLANDMQETMRSASGVGLAAPQVGRPLRLIVCQESEDAEVLTLVNPRISKASGSEVADEACLSLPGWFGPVERHLNIRVKALDERGRARSLAAEGFLARIIQHEIDHLDGIMFTERIVEGGELQFAEAAPAEEAAAPA